MVVQLNALNETMSTGSMDITETFRTEDITKTDFFDFVTAPDTIGIGINDRVTTDTNGSNLDAPLQGFDQVKSHISSPHNFQTFSNQKQNFAFIFRLVLGRRKRFKSL